jgi:hypothetical protein
MESQQEQLTSQEQPAPEPTQEQVSEQVSEQPTQELSHQESDAPEVTGTEESPEEAVLAAAEDKPELVSEDAPEAEEQTNAPVEEIVYNNLSDINLESLSDEVQSHVRPILALAAREVSLMKEQKEALDSARKEFTELMDAMESSGYDVKPLQNRIEEQGELIESVSSDIIDTAWQAFTITHPEFENIPDNARNLFAKELERLYERYEGKTVLDRMNNAYDYSLWKSGVDKNSLSSEKSVTVSEETKNISQEKNQDAKKHAVIADGRIATSAPVRSVDELDWGDVLDRHAHLLDR